MTDQLFTFQAVFTGIQTLIPEYDDDSTVRRVFVISPVSPDAEDTVFGVPGVVSHTSTMRVPILATTRMPPWPSRGEADDDDVVHCPDPVSYFRLPLDGKRVEIMPEAEIALQCNKGDIHVPSLKDVLPDAKIDPAVLTDPQSTHRVLTQFVFDSGIWSSRSGLERPAFTFPNLDPQQYDPEVMVSMVAVPRVHITVSDLDGASGTSYAVTAPNGAVVTLIFDNGCERGACDSTIEDRDFVIHYHTLEDYAVPQGTAAPYPTLDDGTAWGTSPICIPAME